MLVFLLEKAWMNKGCMWVEEIFCKELWLFSPSVWGCDSRLKRGNCMFWCEPRVRVWWSSRPRCEQEIRTMFFLRALFDVREEMLLDWLGVGVGDTEWRTGSFGRYSKEYVRSLFPSCWGLANVEGHGRIVVVHEVLKGVWGLNVCGSEFPWLCTLKEVKLILLWRKCCWYLVEGNAEIVW